MARQPSVVLSPADKKAQVVAVKQQMTDLKSDLKLVAAEIKSQNKDHAARIKGLQKVQLAGIKQLDVFAKQLAALTKKD
jgi:hypothetical protein